MEPMRRVSGIILAGGKSRRMGRDKAWLEFEGVPLVVRVLERVRQLTDDIVIVTNAREPFAALGVPLVADEVPNAGPLAGIAAGLGAVRGDYALVVACDMPFLNVELCRYLVSLADGYDVVIPNFPDPEADAARANTKKDGAPRGKDLDLHPLHAVYSQECLAPIRRALSEGDRRMVAFHADVRVRVVSPHEIASYDPQGKSFRNLNTPDDLARAQEL